MVDLCDRELIYTQVIGNEIYSYEEQNDRIITRNDHEGGELFNHKEQGRPPGFNTVMLLKLLLKYRVNFFCKAITENLSRYFNH